MSTLPVFNSDSYEDGRTKQSFKDDTDINKLLARAAQGDTITHLAKHGAIYGDFSDIDDLLTANARLQRGQKIFDELPGEVKREFNQSPAAFYKFVNDPANADQLERVVPGLAQRGTQLPSVARNPRTMGVSDTQTPEPPGEPGADNAPPAE